MREGGGSQKRKRGKMEDEKRFTEWGEFGQYVKMWGRSEDKWQRMRKMRWREELCGMTE
jgi:hypothetical protein